ncbi:hypothetical protein TYRP_010967 [Tyrophagus putrescentiae]|nr:hypothetical protein TYRP_010967 [Tyrophagus putrescentiae]
MKIMKEIRFGVRLAMAKRCKMEAVQQSRSNDVQMSQRKVPSVQLCVISEKAPRGITRQATIRSATASESTR